MTNHGPINPRHHRERPPVPGYVHDIVTHAQGYVNSRAITRAKGVGAPFTFLGPDKESTKRAYYQGIMDGLAWEQWGYGYAKDSFIAWLGSTDTAEQVTGQTK